MKFLLIVILSFLSIALGYKSGFPSVSSLISRRFGNGIRKLQQANAEDAIDRVFSIDGGAGTSRVHHISNGPELESFMKKTGIKGLVVLDFTASWCPPCKMIAPVFEELSTKKENKSVHFVKVDVDEAADVAQRFGVQSMPTFVFLKNGAEVRRFSGASTERLISTINEFK